MSRCLTACCLLVLLGAAPALADYTTPGLGVNWTLDDLVAAAGGAVTGADGSYAVHASVTVAVSDTLTAASGDVLTFLDTTGDVVLEVQGALLADGGDGPAIRFTSATGQPGDWGGLVHRDTGPGSAFVLRNAVVEYCAIAVDVVYADVDLEACQLRYTSEKALDLTGGGGTVRGCHLYDNQQRTVNLTLGSSPVIEDCWLQNNNLENASPYPYISIGLQGVNSPVIRRCMILGGGQYMSGGIAVWNACEGLIEDCLIRGCGYGILCYQAGANPTIRGNTIVDNNIHPDTLNWGFGVAVNGPSQPIVAGNTIDGHWYGVAIINGGQPNLGDLGNADPDDDGENRLVGNGLDGVRYEIYNNTALPIMAENNFYGWDDEFQDLDDVEAVIYHQVDDPSLGPVDFDPSILNVVPVGVPDTPRPALALHGARPNPCNPRTALAFTLGRESAVTVAVHDLRGQVVRSIDAGRLTAGEHQVAWDGTGDGGRALPSGTYLYRVTAAGETATGKVQLVR